MSEVVSSVQGMWVGHSLVPARSALRRGLEGRCGFVSFFFSTSVGMAAK